VTKKEKLSNELINALNKLSTDEAEELNLEPVTPIEGSVSTLVKEMRNERDNALLRCFRRKH